ncbi:MAG: DUF5696 domain-containing protein, partial [Planctomycetota bacterium]
MSMDTQKLQDDRLSIEVIDDNDAVWLLVMDRQTGKEWGPDRLVTLDVHDKTLRREDRLEQYRVDKVEKREGRIHVVVGDSYRGILVGLWLHLEDGELVVRISIPEVYERRPEHFRLFAVDVASGLMEAGPNGRLLLPLGNGTLCHPADKPAVEDEFLIYGEQPRWELSPLMPFCAADTPDGGLMALASDAEWDALCRVATDGEGNGTTGFAFSLRRHWPDPVECNTRELRFIPYTSEDDAVHFCAGRLRRWVIEQRNKSTLRERVEESPELAYVADALVTKMGFGQEAEGLEMHDKREGPVTFHLGMTFDEAAEGLKRLHDAGIDSIHTMMVGWNPRGHDGLYPTRFPIDERLGGEEGFRDLIQTGQDLGYQMNVHDNFSMNVPQSPDWDPECLTHDMYGEPLLHGWWSGGLEYQSWPLAFSRERLKGHLERMKDLGIRGMYYCDYMMSPLEVNYHPEHKGGRGDHLRGQIRVWETVRDIFGACATEHAPLPAAIHCDYVCYASGRNARDDWPVSQLMDENVPVWELAMHGLLIVERSGIDWPSVMKQVSFGEH